MDDLTPALDNDNDSLEENAEDTKLEVPETRNGNRKILQRIETVPDIKRDTSGITTQYIAAGIVNLGALASGVCVAWSSSALPLLSPGHPEISEFSTIPNATHRLTIYQSEASWVASLLCLGALFGAVPAGLISQYFGRKKTLLYLALPLVVSWILVASSPNVYGLYVGRLVGGVAVGAFSVSVPPYIEDIAEKPLLPTLANFYHLHFTCGVLFGYIIGMVNSVSWHCLLCASIPVAFFIAFIFLPESPAYLLSQGKFAEAKTSLTYFRGIDNDVDSEIKSLKENIRNSLKHKVTFKELFSTRATIKALVVSFGLMIFQQLSGIYPILFYADSVFKPFEISLNPPAGAIILGFSLVTSTYFSSMLLKTIRRRILLIISLTTMAMSLGGLATYYHLKASNSITSNSTWVPLLTLCIYVSMYAAGIGPIPWLMLREIFPANVTRRATAITAGFHWFLAFGVTKLYQNLVEKVSPGWTLCHFSVTCIVGAIFVYFFVPETKGRTLQEIQDEFEGIHRHKKHTHVIEVECGPE
ncbi:facilitated trehalose transporter Tret1-like isoform X2 [Pectinophora gossypiella]|uniref:facilitated trehalose transporter Tret1-like isoform X1 n=1 Tax=Pectinophora gossypiella TaxID=13191 RepID=UPI00214F2EEE|nr:facilitated trehalose transporter Tret1-like isoform X1 [Pectinophora gossypiella]XP_049880666.1 facilitated trehalose transporter Tret1-like isoform X2 [Pectinophora gossypiella]